MSAHRVRILHTTVARRFDQAYAFAQKPENFQKWAAGLSKTLKHTDKGWVADTPEGEAMVRFSDPNDHGVLDHWVSFEGKPEIYIPLRMVANGDHTEVELVLFKQPGMTEAQFAGDAERVIADLQSLKSLLERSEEGR